MTRELCIRGLSIGADRIKTESGAMDIHQPGSRPKSVQAEIPGGGRAQEGRGRCRGRASLLASTFLRISRPPRLTTEAADVILEIPQDESLPGNPFSVSKSCH